MSASRKRSAALARRGAGNDLFFLCVRPLILGGQEMRKSVASSIFALLAVLALSSAAIAQTQAPAAAQARPKSKDGFIAEGIPKMPNPPGPAPKQDLTGAWVGPQDR